MTENHSKNQAETIAISCETPALMGTVLGAAMAYGSVRWLAHKLIARAESRMNYMDTSSASLGSYRFVYRSAGVLGGCLGLMVGLQFCLQKTLENARQMQGSAEKELRIDN